jgi:hypothetical protein
MGILIKYQKGGYVKNDPNYGYYHRSKDGTTTYVMSDGEPQGLTTTIVHNKNGDRWMKKTYTSGDSKGKIYGKVEKLTPVINGKLMPKKDVLTFESYMPKLMRLENGIKKGYNSELNIWFPHDSVEGGSKTVAYGHKLKKGESFDKGIPNDLAMQLLQKDLLEHRAAAAKEFNKRFGAGEFEKLREGKQVLLTDYHFNGVYNDFPKFIEALYKNDWAGVEKEYKRSSAGKPLESRNKATFEFIQMLKNN